MPAVTIVIPAYNPGPLLNRALRSVVEQTTQDWECVVVDDGGEEALDWLDTYHPQVRRFRQANGGVSIARNQALLLASSPLVAYLDQDDEWVPEKLECQLARLGDADLSYTAFVWVRSDGSEQLNEAPAIDYMQFLREGHICLSSLLVRRTALGCVGGFNQLLRVQQDYDLMLRLLAVGARSAPLEQVLTRCYLHAGNVSRDYQRALWERLHILELHEMEAARRSDAAALRAAREGKDVARRLYAAQAFTMFRKERTPMHLGRAFMWSPAETSAELVRAARRHKIRIGD